MTPATIRRRLARRGGLWLWTALASVAPYGAGVISVSVLTKLLPPSDYGVWAVLGSTLGLLISIAAAGIDVAAVPGLVGGDDRAERARRYGAALILSAVIGVGVAVLFALSAPFLSSSLLGRPGATWLLMLIALVTPFSVGPRLLAVLARAWQRFDLFAAVILLEQTVTVVGSIVGASIAGLGGVATGYVASKIAFGSAAVVFAIRHATMPDRALVGGLLRASLPLAVLPALSWALNLSDRWIVSAIAGTEAVGIYAAGYAIGSFELIVFAPAGLVFLPRIIRLWTSDRVAAWRYAKRMNLILATAGATTAALLALASGTLLRSLTTDAYLTATSTAMIVAFASMFLGLTTVPNHLLIAQGRNRTVSVIYAITTGGSIPLTIALVTALGAVGAAWATLASYAFLLAAQMVAAVRQGSGAA